MQRREVDSLEVNLLQHGTEIDTDLLGIKID